MEYCIILTFFCSMIYRVADSCVATSDVGTTTTTTTEPPPVSCATCTARQITFTPANPQMAGSINATFTEPGPDENGCSRLIATCIGQMGYVAYMQFNLLEGGPIQNDGMPQIVMAPLECINGDWIYNPMARNITEVNCSEAFPMG